MRIFRSQLRRRYGAFDSTGAKLWLLPILGAILALPAQTLAAEPAGQPGSVAIVGDRVISNAELHAAVENNLKQLQMQEYEVKRKALEQVIQEKLLEAEAQKRGIRPEELVTVAPATEAEVRAYYLAQAERLNRPFEEVRSQLEQSLQQAKLRQARESYARTLREKTPVVILLRPPATAVTVDASRVKGRPDAPVTIVEFSDFQCPYCRRVVDTLKDVAAKYSAEVRIAFRDFPLRIHPDAQLAAEAARCAVDQGKFWEYHDVLFDNQDKLDRAGLLDHARALNLKEAVFQGCLDSGKYKDAVEKDLQEGQTVGVNGTPAFFINGVFLSGAQPASAFEKVIEEELAYLRYMESCRKNNTCKPASEGAARR
jgi:protein-disulfide isomerase